VTGRFWFNSGTFLKLAWANTVVNFAHPVVVEKDSYSPIPLAPHFDRKPKSPGFIFVSKDERFVIAGHPIVSIRRFHSPPHHGLDFMLPLRQIPEPQEDKNIFAFGIASVVVWIEAPETSAAGAFTGDGPRSFNVPDPRTRLSFPQRLAFRSGRRGYENQCKLQYAHRYFDTDSHGFCPLFIGLTFIVPFQL
jgi:hypothetical protein